MKTDRKTKAEKSPPKVKAVKRNGRAIPKPDGKHPLAAYEHIPVGIVEASRDGKFMDVNEEFCRITGFEKRELLKGGIKDFTYEEDYGLDITLYEQLIAGKIPFYRLEKRFLCKDGGVVWVELTRTLVCDARGQPLYTVGVVLDISDRKDVERVLRESVERLRLATGAAKMFMWEWDFQTQSYTIADSFEQVLGFSGGLLPRNKFETLWALSPREDIECISEAFEQAVERQSDLHALPYRVINPENGQIVWLEISAKIVYDRAGNPERMFGVAQNITENKKAETALQLARRQAEQSADRTARLQKVTAALSEAFTAPQVAEVLTNQGAPAFGAVSSSMMLLSEDGQTLEILYSTSAESLVRLYKSFPISLQIPAADAARSGQPVWIESRQQYLERYPHLAEQINLWGQQAAIAIPMVYKERILGVLTLSFDRVLTYNLEDRDYALTLARQAAQALDRARAENALRESEERFRALVSRATAGIAESDLDSHLVFVNPGFCEMLGYSETELLGKTIWELTHTQDLEENQRLFKRMLEQGESYQFEKRFIRKDGSRLWTSVSVTTIHDLAGKPKGGVGVVLDIEKRKQAEVALAEYARQQESLYRLSDQLHRTESLTEVFDAALDAILHALQCDRASILLFDDQDVMRFVAWRGLSDAYRTATEGHSPWKPDARDPQTVVMDDIRTGELSESLRAVIEAEGIGSLAFIPLISNGTLIGKFMVYFDAPHVFDEGELDLSLTIGRQLATGIDRKRAEEELRESEERFRTLANAMPSIVWTAAPDGTITYVNDQWLHYVGITPEENAKSWPELGLHPDDYERCVREWTRALETVPDEYLIEVRNRRYDGQYRWFQTRAVPVRDASGKALAWYGVTTDIHERIEAEQRLTLLAGISEMLRNFDEPNELMYRISEAVGEHLRVRRALFNEIDLEIDREIVHRDYHNGLDSVAGIHRVSAYSSITSAEMQAGKTVINSDAKDDPRTAQDYERTYAVSGERAYVAVPLMRDNRWVASFWVSDDVPRQWTREEVSLLETVAERTWAIIEKLRIDTALRESEQRYRAVVESQVEMLCRFQPDGTILFANGAYARARGTTPEALASRNFWEFIAEEDRPSVKAMLDGLTPEAPQVQIENRFHTVDGERWTLWTNRALRFDANGRLLEAQSSGIDITERKEVEEALRASEERMRLATDAASMYAWELDVQNQILTLSENFAEVLGFPADLVPENNIEALQRLSPAEDAQIVQEALAQAFEKQENLRDLQYRIVNPENGQVVWVEVNARTIYDRDGKPQRMYGVSQNITERKQSENALRVRARQQQAVAKLGELALRERDLQRVFDRATATIAETLEIEYCKVLELLPGGESLLLRSGVGWQEGMLGTARVGAGLDSQAGFTLRSESPVVVDDLREETRFAGSPLLFNHGVISGMSCIIRGAGGLPWGVLGAHATRRMTFTEDDVNFLVAVANILGDAIQREQAEEALRASEERYRFIVENTSDGIWWVELTEPMPLSLPEEEQIDWYYRHAVLRQCNLGLARMYGYDSIEEVVGLPMRILMPRENAVNLELSRQFIRSGYRLVDAESREVNQDGRELVFLNNMVGIVENGTLVGEWGTNRDITERKRAEEALRASESLYRTIARSIPGGGVYVVDKDFRYLVAEGPVTEAFGLSREMLEGHTVMEVFPDERGRRMEERLRRNFAGESLDFETQFNRRFYWTQMAPVHDSIGQSIILTLDITERKQAEEALRQSEERFALFMQHLPGLAWIKDVDGRYVYTNAAAEKAFNTPREQLYGNTDEDIFSPETAAQFKRNDQQALSEGVQVVETLKQEDGIVHHSLVTKFPIPGPDGNTALIGGTAFDITERLQAEEALRESEERFRAILRQATAGIVRKNAEGRLIFVNEAFCNMLGRTEAELLGKTIWEFMHPDDRAENKRFYDRMMLEGVPFKLEKRFLREDGSVIWVDASISPIMDATGKPQSSVAVEVDITGRKQAEEALRQLNLQLEERVLSRTARLRAVNQTLREEIAERKKVEEALRTSEATARLLLNTAPDGVVITDGSGVIVHANAQIASLFGYEPDEVLGKQIEVLIPERFHDKHIRHRRTYNEQRRKRVMGLDMELFGRRKNGNEFPVDVMLTPISNIPDWNVMVTIRDDTERKEMESALRKSHERLRILSQRLVEVQEEERRAIARELHDRVGQTLAALNINLIIIGGQLGGQVDEQISTRLNDSMKLVAETIGLVRDVMSNLRPAVLDDYGLEVAIESYLSQYTSRYEIHAKFEKPDPPIPRLGPSIEMTFLRIAQEALMNIAKHAHASEVMLSLRQENNAVHLTIQDNGTGIESWESVNRPGSHGLTIMRERAEAFGGNLKVSSVPGNGTTVEVKIPIETNDPSQSQKEKSL